MPESRIAPARSRNAENVHQLHDLIAPSTARRVSGLMDKLNTPERQRAGGRKPEPERALPDYLEALKLVSGAGQTMQSMEEESARIQAKAFELMQQARTDRQEAHERIAELANQLTASEARAEQLEQQLAEMELRAQTAEQWLGRFMETVNEAFAVRKSRLDEAELFGT